MKISVLIAAYEAAAFLPGALQSFSAQTHADRELIVVEDGSRDGTEELVRAFAAAFPDQAVTYENLGRNQGVAAARNRLLTLARGDAVAFLDADDLWRETHLADLHTALVNGAALAFSGIELWDGDRGESLGDHVPPAAWIRSPRTSLFTHSFIQTSSCVALPRATIERTGRIDESLRIGEDRDYWFRAVAGGGRLACTGRSTCRYTKHAGSSMTKTLRVAADTVAFYRKHHDDASLPAALRRRQLAQALIVQGRLLRAGEPRRASGCFRQAVGLRPWAPLAWAGWFLTATAR